MNSLFQYQSAEEAAIGLEARGGLIAAVGEWMAGNGFSPTDAPEDGDIGVASHDLAGRSNSSGPCVVIRYSGRWIGKAPRGLAALNADGVPAWRIV